MKEFKQALQPYKVKSRKNPSWPGTLYTHCPDTTYQIVFYRNTLQAKEILKKVNAMSDWSRPSHPEDLAFFKGNQCWFYSVGHEKIAGILYATDKDIDFVVSKGLAERENVRMESSYDYYNETLEP